MRQPDLEARVKISLDHGSPGLTYCLHHRGERQPFAQGGLDWDAYLRLALPNLIAELSLLCMDFGCRAGDGVIDPAALEDDLGRLVPALALALPQGRREADHPPPPSADAPAEARRRVSYQIVRPDGVREPRRREHVLLVSPHWTPYDYAGLIFSMSNTFARLPQEPQRHVRCRFCVAPSSSALLPRTEEAVAARDIDHIVALLERGDYGIITMTFIEVIPDDPALGLCRSQLFWACAVSLPAAPHLVDAIPPYALGVDTGYEILPYAAEVGARAPDAAHELFPDAFPPAVPEALVTIW